MPQVPAPADWGPHQPAGRGPHQPAGRGPQQPAGRGPQQPVVRQLLGAIRTADRALAAGDAAAARTALERPVVDAAGLAELDARAAAWLDDRG